MNSSSEFLRRVARVASLAAALGAIACSSATSPTQSDVRFVVESQPSTPISSSNFSAANAAGGPGAVVVIGRVGLPTPCYSLSARLARSGYSLDLTVVATPTSAGCGSAATSQAYTLRVGSLSSGTYHVRLTHEREEAIVFRELVLEKDVPVE